MSKKAKQFHDRIFQAFVGVMGLLSVYYLFVLPQPIDSFGFTFDLSFTVMLFVLLLTGMEIIGRDLARQFLFISCGVGLGLVCVFHQVWDPMRMPLVWYNFFPFFGSIALVGWLCTRYYEKLGATFRQYNYMAVRVIVGMALISLFGAMVFLLAKNLIMIQETLKHPEITGEVLTNFAMFWLNRLKVLPVYSLLPAFVTIGLILGIRRINT